MIQVKQAKVSAKNIDELKASSKDVANMLKNLANPHRLLILCLLSEGELSVGQLAEHIDLEQSPLSQHLARLRAEGLVKTRKESQTVYYSIADPNVEKIIGTLHSIYC
ncbi:MAG: DNA-binding transcriptional ArsR family regulator [Arenicella sp.]|jgi:DNA-binding transcriptional ArsR family regulator